MTKSSKHQHKLIGQGLCPQCSQPLDRDGWYCLECLEKNRSRRKSEVKFYVEHGLCRVCGKNKSQPNSTYCEDCSARQYIYNKKRYKDNPDYCRQKKRESDKRRYEECKANGVCTKCRKRKAEKGKVKCRICLDQDALRHKYGRKERTYDSNGIS